MPNEGMLALPLIAIPGIAGTTSRDAVIWH
jgi:hypothetical protein